MLFLRSLLLLGVLGHSCWAADATATKSVKQIEASVSLTNVPPPSSFGEESKNTEKRDSRGQLGTFHFAKNNDGPFRPMLPPDYLTDTSRGESSSSSYLSAAAASPQVYYNPAPPQFKYATHFKDSPRPEGGITYASSAYRGPFRIEHQASSAPAASSHQGLHEVASPKQVQAYFEDARPKLQGPPAPSHYTSAPQHQQHQFQVQHQHHHQQQPLQSHQTQQQQFQYIIAIPMSYVKRLQQQMAAGGQHSQHSQQQQQYITPISGAPHHQPLQQHLQEIPASATNSKSGSPAQIIGPLARDHSGAYRPYQAPSMANPNVQYVMRYIQVPINSPLLYQKQMPVVYSTPSSYYQPAYPEINQPQPHHQHQHQATLRYESKQPEAGPTVRYSSSAPPAPGKPHASKLVAAAPPSPPPGPTYSSLYVTPPPSHQHYPLNYVRFAQPGLSGPTPTPYSLPPPFMRLPAPVHMTAAAAAPGLSDLLQTTQQHYYALPHGRDEMVYPMQSPVAGHVYTPQEAALPYFNHPAGVHYGTHLYHPQALLKNSLAAAEVAAAASQAEAASNQEAPASQQQQQHQHQQQQQTSYVKHPAPGNGYAKVSSAGSGIGATAAATTSAPAAGVTQNIVKYP